MTSPLSSSCKKLLYFILSIASDSNLLTTKNNVTTTVSYAESTKLFTVGSCLQESSNSLHKFLIREYTNGYFYYVSHNDYESVSFGKRPTTTTKPITTSPTASQSIANGMTNNYPLDDFLNDLVTTMAYPVAEYYINITESSVQITDITEEVSYNCSYDKDYSSVLVPINKTTTQIVVSCKGYTDPDLVGKRLILSVGIDCFYDESIKEIVSNTIKPDGTFEYKVVYVATEQMNTRNQYSFNSISIK